MPGGSVMKKKIIVIFLFAVLSIPFSKALASGSTQRAFDLMDTDKDGKISKDEYMAFQAKISEAKFKKTDANSDGMLTKEEMKAAFRAFKEAIEKRRH